MLSSHVSLALIDAKARSAESGLARFGATPFCWLLAMVNSETAAAMVQIYAQKHGITQAEALERMFKDPSIKALLEREEIGGVSAAIARDRQLAYGSKGRLEPITTLLHPHVEKLLSATGAGS